VRYVANVKCKVQAYFRKTLLVRFEDSGMVLLLSINFHQDILDSFRNLIVTFGQFFFNTVAL
jgi:hypothetical protein